MTTEEDLRRWKIILDIETFRVGDPIKFKWTDLRRRSWRRRERTTWTFGYITGVRRDLGYFVEVVKGGILRDGVLVTFKDAKLWFPRKQ